MLLFRTYVLETIRVPDGIYKGKRDPTRKIYRKHYAEVPGLGNALDLLVFVGEKSGYIGRVAASLLGAALFAYSAKCAVFEFSPYRVVRLESTAFNFSLDK